ncbi:general secretion pathway protein GspB [Shewanella waksmanii]|uniref:general secretion pathway protein GspB n=1 Tax=Shewanella waksmanii TaxID=213783 RepID=UPI003735E393
MSILLDAVTRAKQQQSGQLDPVMAPRAQTHTEEKRVWPWAKLGLLLSAILLSIGGAWLFNQFFELKQSSASKPPMMNTQADSALANDKLVSKAQLNRETNSETVSEMTNDMTLADSQSPASVRLAGKVALPVAKPFTPTASPEPITIGGQPMATLDYGVQAQTQIATQTSPAEVQPSRVTNAVNEPEPIILGANSNQRGQDLLNSLKYQVEAAANDVGFDDAVASSQSAQQLDNRANSAASDPQPAAPDNNLVAAFEAALLELERENSVATPVTQPELDPIPATPSDELPRYGELPAGIQLQVPEFNILAHVYSSDPNNRWLNVDGAELQQGDKIGGKMTIVEIRPRDVVLEVSGTEFKVPAI